MTVSLGQGFQMRFVPSGDPKGLKHQAEGICPGVTGSLHGRVVSREGAGSALSVKRDPLKPTSGGQEGTDWRVGGRGGGWGEGPRIEGNT